MQDVLTVEWSGHKTVLVEVPAAAPSRNSEVEMLGMGDRTVLGDYGRLEDDDEVSDQFQPHTNQAGFERENIADSAGTAIFSRSQRIL